LKWGKGSFGFCAPPPVPASGISGSLFRIPLFSREKEQGLYAKDRQAFFRLQHSGRLLLFLLV
jgi:hypothetical protein